MEGSTTRLPLCRLMITCDGRKESFNSASAASVLETDPLLQSFLDNLWLRLICTCTGRTLTTDMMVHRRRRRALCFPSSCQLHTSRSPSSHRGDGIASGLVLSIKKMVFPFRHGRRRQQCIINGGRDVDPRRHDRGRGPLRHFIKRKAYHQRQNIRWAAKLVWRQHQRQKLSSSKIKFGSSGVCGF